MSPLLLPPPLLPPSLIATVRSIPLHPGLRFLSLQTSSSSLKSSQLFVGTASGSVFSFLVPKSIETGVEVVEAFHVRPFFPPNLLLLPLPPAAPVPPPRLLLARPSHLLQFQAHTEAIPAILYLASMAYLVTSSFDGEVSLWHKHDDKSPPLLLVSSFLPQQLLDPVPALLLCAFQGHLSAGLLLLPEESPDSCSRSPMQGQP
eukprot:767361-Hanusia_phi.AAC.2